MRRKLVFSVGRSGVAFLLIAILLTACVSPLLISKEAFAETAEAYAIKFSSQTGSGFQITNSSGRSVAIRKDMRLYSGYVLQTAAGNYVYLSLDSKKAVKLDQNTKVEIQKEGTKNVIKVLSGKLFFNVSEKLKEAESFDVSTSTLSMGIRGTSGCVTADLLMEGDGRTKLLESIHIYDGLGNVQNTEKSGRLNQKGILLPPGKKTEKSIELGAGKKQSKLDAPEDIKLEDIPFFTLEEMQKDKALFKRIKAGMSQMNGISRNKLKELMGQAKAKEEEIQKQKDSYHKQKQEDVQRGHRVIGEPEDIITQTPETEKPSDTSPMPTPNPETPDTGSSSGSSSSSSSSSSSGGGTTSSSKITIGQENVKLSKAEHKTTGNSEVSVALECVDVTEELSVQWCNAQGTASSEPAGISMEITEEKVFFYVEWYCSGTFYFRVCSGGVSSNLCTLEVESNELSAEAETATLYLFGNREKTILVPDGFSTSDIHWYSDSDGFEEIEWPEAIQRSETVSVSDLAVKVDHTRCKPGDEYYFRFVGESAYSKVYTLAVDVGVPARTAVMDKSVTTLNGNAGYIALNSSIGAGDPSSLSVYEKNADGYMEASKFTASPSEHPGDSSVPVIQIVPKSGEVPEDGEHILYIVYKIETTDEQLVVEPVTITYHFKEV